MNARIVFGHDLGMAGAAGIGDVLVVNGRPGILRGVDVVGAVAIVARSRVVVPREYLLGVRTLQIRIGRMRHRYHVAFDQSRIRVARSAGLG